MESEKKFSPSSEEKSFIHSSFASEDQILEKSLRPQSLDQFIGQKELCERLKILIQAASSRGDPLSHILLSGPPGLGKTTLAHILSKTLGTSLTITSGPSIEKAADLAGLLTGLKERDFLFIDEIHRLPKAIEEYLYSAMEDYVLDVVIDSGPSARSVRLNLQPFTLIGATTRSGLLSAPMRSRFGFSGRLDFYSNDDLQQIVLRTADVIDCPIESDAALEIAKRCRGTPRIANNLVRWVRDYAEVKKVAHVSKDISKSALSMLSIDEEGLDEMDTKILHTIINHFEGGPVGVQSLSVALGEEVETICEVHEPYLILKGFIKRTMRGREVTPLAYTHMGIQPPTTNSGEEL